MTEANDRYSILRSGPVLALTGAAVVSGLILLVSGLADYEKGVPTAAIMFAGSVGIVSSGLLDWAAKRRGRTVNTTALVLNAILSSIAVYLLVSLLMDNVFG